MKETLIKLIQEAVGGCARYWAERIAFHIMETGITLQRRWVPTQKALPDSDKKIEMYFSLKDAFCYGRYYETGKYFKWFVVGPDGLIKSCSEVPDYWRYAETEFEVEVIVEEEHNEKIQGNNNSCHGEF